MIFETIDFYLFTSAFLWYQDFLRRINFCKWKLFHSLSQIISDENWRWSLIFYSKYVSIKQEFIFLRWSFATAQIFLQWTLSLRGYYNTLLLFIIYFVGPFCVGYENEFLLASCLLKWKKTQRPHCYSSSGGSTEVQLI